MPKIHLVAVLAVALTGCAAPLQTAIDVTNALSAGNVGAGAKVNADFGVAEKACLVGSDNAAVRACLDKTEAKFVPALTAFDDFTALLLFDVAVIHTEEAREKAGGAPALEQVTALVPELLALAMRFNAALAALRSTVATVKAAH